MPYLSTHVGEVPARFHVLWALCVTGVLLAACGPANNSGGQTASGGTAGGASTGGQSATGGAPGSGGVSGTGGSLGSGGGPITGSGGQAGSALPGTGGSGVAVGGMGGAGGRGGAATGGAGTGGAGTGGAVGRGGAAGGMATGGNGGRGGATGGSAGGQAGAAGGRTGTLRIMPLGDSTTGSVCWRALLWQTLNQNGYAGKFDFVGSRNGGGCTPSNFDKDNEGHPSILVTNFINDADDLVAGVQTPQALLGAHPADVVLLHFATNDVWNGRSPITILAAYSTVLAALRQANPRVTVLVAKLIPMAVTANTCSGCSCPNCPAGITALNNMIVTWAAANTTATSAVSVVDQWTDFNANAGADTGDGVHPNASGDTKIAARWYAALTPLF